VIAELNFFVPDGHADEKPEVAKPSLPLLHFCGVPVTSQFFIIFTGQAETTKIKVNPLELLIVQATNNIKVFKAKF